MTLLFLCVEGLEGMLIQIVRRPQSYQPIPVNLGYSVTLCSLKNCLWNWTISMLENVKFNRATDSADHGKMFREICSLLF